MLAFITRGPDLRETFFMATSHRGVLRHAHEQGFIGNLGLVGGLLQTHQLDLLATFVFQCLTLFWRQNARQLVKTVDHLHFWRAVMEAI